MKIYYKVKYSFLGLVALLTISLSSQTAISEDRDPFSPTGSTLVDKITPKTENKDEPQGNSSLQPLTSSKLSSYRIVGFISSDKSSIAVVKAVNGLDYFLEEGDALGNEGAIVEDISMEGIEIENNGNSITLPVKNKVDIKPE